MKLHAMFNAIEDVEETAQKAAEEILSDTLIPPSQMKAALKLMLNQELKSQGNKAQTKSLVVHQNKKLNTTNNV
jgi:hypothetical protein